MDERRKTKSSLTQCTWAVNDRAMNNVGLSTMANEKICNWYELYAKSYCRQLFSNFTEINRAFFLAWEFGME